MALWFAGVAEFVCGAEVALSTDSPRDQFLKSARDIAVVSPLEHHEKEGDALDLEKCFEIAAQRSDTLKINQAEIDAAKARLGQAIAGLFPTIRVVNNQNFQNEQASQGGGGGFNPQLLAQFAAQSGNNLGAFGGFGGGGTGQSYNSSTQITLSQPIFNGFQTYNSIGAARADRDARQYNLSRNYQLLYQDVATAFYQVLTNEGDLAVLGDLRKALEARVEELKGRVELGRSRPAELLAAQTDLANVKVTVEQITGLLNATRELMAFYLGIPSGEIKLKDSQALPAAATLETYLAQTGTRPDVLSLLESQRQARRNLSMSRGEWFPTITAFANYLVTQDPASELEWTAGITVSLPIFDGGLIYSRNKERKALVRQSELNVEQLKRTLDQDVRTAYANFNAAIAQYLQLREAAIFSAQNFQAQAEDYRRGVVSNLDVLLALQNFQNVRRQLHTADMNARINLIKLHVAAGMAAREAAPKAGVAK
jgi:outer membrane protein TolC